MYEIIGISERRACQVLGQPRSTQKHIRTVPEDEERLTEQVVSLASQYGRYGCRRITALLRNEGWLFLIRGTPDYIRSDNGPEFTANAVRSWLKDIGVNTLFIEPGSPWENGYVESDIGKLRDELLNGEILDTLLEAKVLVESWRQEYNRFRPHSSLDYKPPALEAKWLEKLNRGVVH